MSRSPAAVARIVAGMKKRLGPLKAYVYDARSQARSPLQPDGIRRFLIVTSGRTGSELLVSLLNSHPQIVCEGELLQSKHISPERLVGGRVERARRLGSRAYGFKLQPQHILDTQHLSDARGWMQSLAAQGWMVIRLRRENRLHQAISVVRRETSQGHHRPENARPYQSTAIDPIVLIGNMCLITHSEQRIDDLLKGIDHLDLTYEVDLQRADDQDATVARICRELDIEPRPASTDLIRMTPSETRQMVANYDEIADEIRRNRFAQYLTD
jgi:LPS sulfotransferase NodH